MQATDAEAPDEAVSPIDHVHDDAPPTLLVHGTHDTLVPIGESQLFAGRATDAGGVVDIVEVAGAHHADDAVSGITSRTAAAAIRTWLRTTVLSPQVGRATRAGGSLPV
jgi:acetyl esterase/lipase